MIFSMKVEIESFYCKKSRKCSDDMVLSFISGVTPLINKKWAKLQFFSFIFLEFQTQFSPKQPAGYFI